MLRARYNDFLGGAYRPHEVRLRIPAAHAEFKVESSDFDRTQMSAMSQLAGWFPDQGVFEEASLQWRPIPVKTVDPERRLLLVPGGLRVLDPQAHTQKAAHYTIS